MFRFGVEWSHASLGCVGVSWLKKGASLLHVWVNNSQLIKVLLQNQRHDDFQLKSGANMLWCWVECNCFQMKVESMVLVSCALRARASKSCFIKADFSCSSWAIRSLLSVTSCVRSRFWSFSLWMACGGAGPGGWGLAAVCAALEGNDCIPEQVIRSLRQRLTSCSLGIRTFMRL